MLRRRCVGPSPWPYDILHNRHYAQKALQIFGQSALTQLFQSRLP